MEKIELARRAELNAPAHLLAVERRTKPRTIPRPFPCA
jgi:hypothetical protein